MDTIKTIYLACESLECLIADIQNAFPDYTGETDISFKEGNIHFIGDIEKPLLDPETGEQTGTELTGKQHANIYVAPDFDESIFLTRMPDPPNNPVNRLAI